MSPYGRSSDEARSDEVHRQLRAQASRSRLALSRLAGRQNVACSFRVVRGEVAEEIVSASTETDVVSLGRFGWALREGRRLGSTARRLLARRDRLVLFGARHLQPGRPVLVVHDGSDAGSEALELAVRLIHGRFERLSILIGGPDEALIRQEIERALGDGRHRARVWACDRLSIDLVSRHARREQAGALLLPVVALAAADDLADLLHAVDCPTLVIS